MYAGRKRRKPVQRAVKQPPAEGAKSNPSKRHRDRLNSELERLASLLPFSEEVTSSLDKLSILRLSVSYVRAKNFFSVALKNHNSSGATANIGNRDNGKAVGFAGCWMPEGELLLQALNGFVLVITAEGTIFYCSHTIQDYLGFHQTDVMHQSVLDLVHTEDQQELRRNLHWAMNPPLTAKNTTPESGQDVQGSGPLLETYNPEQLPPENSSFLERTFVCRFRCLLDSSSGFLALNFQGRLKFLHGQSHAGDDGAKTPAQLALFTIATPLQPPSILEIRTKNMIFRTKHKLDFTPMACDAKGKIVLGYTEAELRVRGSGYQFIHAADLLHCADNHVRMIKTGESGLTVFRLLTKDNHWKWVQSNARLVYKNGKPDYIIATQRPLLEEEGGEHLRKRSMQHPFTFATGEAMLYETSPPVNEVYQENGKTSRSKRGRTEKSPDEARGPGSSHVSVMSQEESVYLCQPAVEAKITFPKNLFGALDNQTDSGALGPGPPEISFDPLLATLDSLSLSNEVIGDSEVCSNGELFVALEGLGLSAEDLELLLLDERMIRVDMDPDYVPTLDDLLTNDEILSFIHDSLEQRCETENHFFPDVLPPASVTVTTLVPETYTTSTPNVHVPYIPCRPPLCDQRPIVHLSQQMQLHLSIQQQPPPLPDAMSQHINQSKTHLDTNGFASHTVAYSATLGDQCNTHQTVPNNGASILKYDAKQLFHQQQYHSQRQQWPSLSSHYACNANGVHSLGSGHVLNLNHEQSLSYGSQSDTTSSDPCHHNGHTSVDEYNMADISCMQFIVNGQSAQENGIHEEETIPLHQRADGKEQLAQILSNFSQHILNVGQACRQLSSQDSYGMFTLEPEDTQQGKVNPSVSGDVCAPAVPKDSVMAPPSGIPQPKPLSNLADSQTTGFIL
ncbi:aryl hydrocarbon receptor [Astyanax mexicanus]|uniref:aryl hydrocarbon receptor n=1 Tax=Astyanax mexicanus TaxID=7994 RepID=UPI0020CAEF06|nr:aryl hydrocarbon receptor [Astyanax mexicanus]